MTVEPIEDTEPTAQATAATTDETESPSASSDDAAIVDGASDDPATLIATDEPAAEATSPDGADAAPALAVDDIATPTEDVTAGATEVPQDGTEAPSAESTSSDDGATEVSQDGTEAPSAESTSSDESATGPTTADDAATAAADGVATVTADDTATETADEVADAPSDGSAEAPAAIDDRPEPTTMEELLSEQTDEIKSLKHGDVVEGQVVRIDKDEILVDIGAKSEGVVSNRELYGRNAESQPQLDIGDTVLVYVLQPESNEGHAVLSLRRAGLERKWRAMQEQLDAGTIIEAPVIDHNKGGLIVDCGIRGFVPISQIVDFPRPPQNEQPRDAAQEIAEKLQPYVGRKLRLKILEVNRKANRLILSEKVALYEERREKRDELFSSLTVGQKVTGTVRSIAPFGVFVDLGGIDGLVHKSELSWNKVNNPEAGYKVGEEVEAEVIDINHERGRISLSIRRLQPDPWHSTVADLKVGDVIDGAVTKIVNFGAFVRVRDGLEGLIHISELSHQRVAHPGDVVHEGQNLKLKVISLDSERHRLGLSLKQAEEAPARPAQAEPRGGERRGRAERSYDPSQAVQEPEEGIDNTLAAAFAQVRQQMAESEAAGTTDAELDEAAVAQSDDAEGSADTEASEAAVSEPEAAAETEAAAEPEAAVSEPDAAAETEA
ncbi:MAG: 30S ribosomal protein S1, partial [Chloroflexi bacterium]|nr:30S ribosomal protein S1 [Chloroflexota bacterium]